jgi:hypothetical protein
MRCSEIMKTDIECVGPQIALRTFVTPATCLAMRSADY